jgi:hypothetical protein
MRSGAPPPRAARWSALVAVAAVLASATVVAGDTPRGDVLWAAVLREHVRSGAVDYDSLSLDRPVLKAYIAWLAVELPQGASRSDSIAFTINAYNACAVELVVQEEASRHGGRVSSIRSIPVAWTGTRWDVGGRKVSLDQMEDSLRAKFREPRVHFALVNTARSAPELRSTPYTGPQLDAQLDSAARAFVLDPTRNQFTPENGRIRISKIFDWFGKDFASVYRDSALERMYGRTNGGVLACVARYLPPGTEAALKERPLKVEYLPYDWSLNAPRKD